MVAGSVPSDSIIVFRREGATIRVITRLGDYRGLRADQILTSKLFNLRDTRDVNTEKLFDEYAELLEEHGPDHEDVLSRGRKVAAALDYQGEGSLDRETYRLLKGLAEARLDHLEPESRKKAVADAALIQADREATHESDHPQGP
jgi:hypothetical protein